MKAIEGWGQGWGAWWALVVLLAGCEGTQRSFAHLRRADGGPSAAETSDGSNVSAADGGLAGGPEDDALLGLGDPCKAASECASRQCVDGVCCDSPCQELCATCAAPGTEGACSPAPSEVGCDALSCPSATECRGRDTTALALNCEGIGACRQSIECPALDATAGTSCLDGAGSCDGDGACVVPGKASLGESCGTSEECAEGHCVIGATGAGICCDAACDGVCQECSANGHCEDVPATDADCEPLNCGASTECRIATAPSPGACSALGQCAQCQAQNQPAGTDCGNDGDCDASGTCRPNATPPTVLANSLRVGAFIDFDRINLIFTAATDDRTAASQLEYAAFHALANTFPATAAQIVSAAAAGSINTLRGFATEAQLESLVLPARARQHFVVVVVRDRSGNTTAYTPTQVTFQDPPSCTLPSDCIDNQCLTLFADSDGDCRGDPNATTRCCTAPVLSRSGCEPPIADITGFAGVTVGNTRFVNNNMDCLDTNRDVYRNQPDFFSVAFIVPPGSPPGAFSNGFDYNCSGQPEPALPSLAATPPCAPPVNESCASNDNDAFYLDGGDPTACGAPTGEARGCFFRTLPIVECQRAAGLSSKECH